MMKASSFQGSTASDQLLDHIETPFHKGTCPGSPVRARARNPHCGDEVELQILVVNNRVEQAWFTGQGCAISQSLASMLCQRIEGMELIDAFQITPSEVLAMIGSPISSVRQRCALLALEALHSLH